MNAVTNAATTASSGLRQRSGSPPLFTGTPLLPLTLLCCAVLGGMLNVPLKLCGSSRENDFWRW